MPPRPARTTLFPYTTLFRSHEVGAVNAHRRTTYECFAVPAFDDGFFGAQLRVLAYVEEEEVHGRQRSEEHTSELQSLRHLVCRLLLEKKKLNYDGVSF